MTETELLHAGLGRKLKFLGRAADMISISLSSTETCPYAFDIHISADGEIWRDGEPLTSTHEIYVPGNKSKQPEVSLFDEKVQALLYGETFILQKLYYDMQHNLVAEFSGGLEIHSLFTPCNETDELWRVFFPWKAEPHLIGTKGSVFLEYYDETQDELDLQKKAWEARRKT